MLKEVYSMEKIHNKLVRDNIPNIIKKDGRRPITRILSNSEYKDELIKKLFEECEEVKSATTPNELLEELADLLEIISACAKTQGKNIEDIKLLAENKNFKNGSFDEKIYLEKVIFDE